MYKRCLIITTQLLILGSAFAVTPQIPAASEERPTHIPAAELNRLIQSGNAPTIIDVRSSREYRSGHVPGAIHLPFWQAFWRADAIDHPGDELVVVYCAHGPRAGIGKLALSSKGFSRIVYLQGHMSGWYEAGLPVEQSSD